MKSAHGKRDWRSNSKSSTSYSRSRVSAGECLEDRMLLTGNSLSEDLGALYSSVDTQVVVTPLSASDVAEPMVGSASAQGFTPNQLRTAYGFNQATFSGGTITGDGTGQTIAIVNAYHTPTAAADLAAFSSYFGLPAVTSFTQVDQNGGTSYPTTNAAWALETALDIQWAHAFAPGASILLVEAASANFGDLTDAVDFARNYPGVSVVSMSWGAAEWPGETSFDHIFTTPPAHTNVTFFAAAGNSGGPGVYPGYSPNTMAVGGTSLTLNGSNQIVNETAWSGSGGGISQYEPQPIWQNGFVTQSADFRTMPDVSFNANPGTGVPVYDSFNNGTSTPWTKVAGTSFATPTWAALVAIANQGRTIAGLQALNTAELMTKIYSMPSSSFNDITSGSSTGTIPQSATAGYDLVTGRGSPKANLVIDNLVGATQTPTGVTLLAVSDTGISNSDRLTRLNNSNVGSKLQFQVTGTVSGATVSIYDGVTLIGTAIASGLTTIVTTNGTSTLTNGGHLIVAKQTELNKAQSQATPSLTVTIDTTPPTASIAAVSPDPRTTPVSSITLQFTEVVSGVNLAALSLTRDGGANLLSGSQSISMLSGTTWSLNNLTSITTLAGLYQLVLDSSLSPIIDIAGNVAGNALESFTVSASNVLGRMLFYNNSKFDGRTPGISASDDAAIAPDKTAYQAGSGRTTFANVSSYGFGINGLMIDLSGSHPDISADDFAFRVGSNSSLESWTVAPAPQDVVVRAGAGVNGSSRIEVIWPIGTIKNQWLEITLLANDDTGLAANDVFYFGSRLGDTGTDNVGAFLTNAGDESAIRAVTSSGIPLTNTFDFTRDGLINAADEIIARSNTGVLYKLDLGAPAAPEAIAAAMVDTSQESPLSAPVAAPLTITSSQPTQAPVIALQSEREMTRGLAFAAASVWSQRLGQGSSTAGVDVEDDLLDTLLGERLRRRLR